MQSKRRKAPTTNGRRRMKNTQYFLETGLWCLKKYMADGVTKSVKKKKGEGVTELEVGTFSLCGHRGK